MSGGTLSASSSSSPGRLALHVRPLVITRRNPYLNVAGLLLLVMLYVSIQSAFFSERADELKALSDFGRALFGAEKVYALEEYWIRLSLLIANALTCAVLFALRFLSVRTLSFALIWPLTTFLFTKIYWEFYVFPLCLVSYDLDKRREIAFIAFVVLLGWTLKEGNLAVLAAFRAILLCQKAGFPLMAPISFMALGVGIDRLVTSVPIGDLPFVGDALSRFAFTREVANPEYSLVETMGVFLTSMHFFTLHTALWEIDAVFSALVILSIVIQPGFMKRLYSKRVELLAIFAVIVGMSEITHAFQNARYYFFFLPLIAHLVPTRQYFVQGILGLAHVAFKVVEVV